MATKATKTTKATIPQRWEELVKEFKTEVHDHGKTLDPSDEIDWHSMTIGWAIAKGLPADQSLEGAYNFANHVRYDTPLG